MPGPVFPVVYARDVGAVVRFYTDFLGFTEIYRLPEEGEPGYVGLTLEGSRLGVVTTDSPEQLSGVKVGSDPRFELFVYVDDVDDTVTHLHEAGARVLREAEDMPWGERVAYAADPEGNPVALAAPASRDADE